MNRLLFAGFYVFYASSGHREKFIAYTKGGQYTPYIFLRTSSGGSYTRELHHIQEGYYLRNPLF